MSRARVPQADLSAGPLSVLSTPLPPTNQPTTAGTLAGILSGGIDAATRAVGFMGAVESVKAREAVISYRANRDAIREAERYAAQVAAAERNNESLMRGQAARDFDEHAIQIRAAFASGDLDKDIGRTVDAETLTRMATEYADMRTVGMGADSAYTDEFRRQTIQLVGSIGVQRQAQLQEADRQDNITSLQRRLATVTTPEEVSAIREETKGLVNLTDEQWADQVLTPALQGRAATSADESTVTLAKTFISDARVVASIENTAARRKEENEAVAKTEILNNYSLRYQAAVSSKDVAALTSLQKDVNAFQSDKKNADVYPTLNAQWSAIGSAIEEIRKEEVFAQAQATHSKSVADAISLAKNGDGFALREVETPVPGSQQAIKTTVSEIKDAAFNDVVASSRQLYPDNPIRQIEHQIDYVSQSRNMPSEWSRLLVVGESAADSLMLDTADGKESPIPTQTVAAFELYKSIAARSPSLLSELVPYEQRKFYERTMSAQRRGVVGNDVRAAMLSAKNSIKLRPNRVDLSATTLVESMQSMGVDMTNGLWGGPNPTWTATENAFVNLVDLFADYSPAEAAKRAAEELEPKIVNVNGFKTLMTNPPAPQNKDAFEESVNDRLLAIAESKKLSLGDLYIVEDVASGMLRVSDRSTLTVVDSIDPRELAKPMQENKAKFAVVGQNFAELVRTNPALMLSYNEFAKSMSPAKAKQAVVDSFNPKSARRDTQNLRSKQGVGIDMSIADDMSADLKTRYPNIK